MRNRASDTHMKKKTQSMTARAFHAAMPAMRDHEGVWEGTYRHIGPDADIIDQHHVRIRCEFPTEGDYVYIQHNHFIWDDGREYKAVLPGVFRNGRLWWDTDSFHGSAWQTKDGFILLNLDRKDERNSCFYEMIMMGSNQTGVGAHRARTWHWFRDGQLYKRTLCDETKISLDGDTPV